MAELTFVGAAGTVTGSKHLLSSNGKRIFIDCGLFQGASDVVALNSVPLPVPPAQLDAVIITHGHIDHVGYLPKLVRDGFRGPIFAATPTRALMRIVLEDAAHLQRHLHKRGFHQEPYAPPPFYDDSNVQQTIQQTKTMEIETPFQVAGFNALYKNAAHIIGSAFVTVEVEGKRVIFSGDIGRYNRTLLYDPAPMGAADVLVCESTYGDRVHPPDALEQLGQMLVAGVARGGAIVIPAFAVERSQEILLSIGQLQRTNPPLAKVPVFLDSPMAAKVDKLFDDYPTWHKPVAFETDGKPFGCDNLTVAVETEQSKAINAVKGPHIIVSASGMAAGGRVLHHLHNHVSDPKATVLFVGFQSPGTLGFLITNGAKTVKIYGDVLPVCATTGIISGYSAHADRNEIQQWLDTCTSKPTYYAVHGDPVSAQSLADLVKMKYGWDSHVAARGTTVQI
ncbi:MAG TPA: MBL fold metallo-hydrolase [Candidatus Rubrimentiphilum sp.]|nr:MBL fold metallo-hydrolase [Candidatus Rubrimentiphilum sp.]